MGVYPTYYSVVAHTAPSYQADPGYRYIQLSIPQYEQPDQDVGCDDVFSLPGTFKPQVLLNGKAREIVVNKSLSIEGKLGCGRPGRSDYENQAGERGIIVLEQGARNKCPSDKFLQSIGYHEGCQERWLFVTRKDNSTSPELWKIPVMEVGAALFEGLLSFVQNKFTSDCNALPPVYMRVSSRSFSSDFRVVLSVSTQVTRWSFDGIAHHPVWPLQDGKHPGLSGKWTPRDDDGDAFEELRVTHGAGGMFMLVDREPSTEESESIAAATVVSTAEEGVAVAAEEVGEPDVTGSALGGTASAAANHDTQVFILSKLEYQRLFGLLYGTTGSSDTTSCFITVRYAAPLGSVRDRAFLRTPRVPVKTASGVLVDRKLAQNVLWKVLHLVSSTTAAVGRRTRSSETASPASADSGGSDDDDDTASTASDDTVHGDGLDVDESSDEEDVGVAVDTILPVTMDEVTQGLLPCLPVQCGEGLVRVVAEAIMATRREEPTQSGDIIIVDSDSLLHIVTLFKGLAAQSSVVVMIPYDCIPHLRVVLASPDHLYLDSEVRTELEELCPEIYRVLMTTRCHARLFPLVCEFVEGLCCVVEEWALCGVAPPEFQPTEGSAFNPEATGMAYRMTPSGACGRVPRRYMKDQSESDLCNKKFPQMRGRTGGIFVFLCVVHGLALGMAMIPKAEGRRDPFWAVYLNSKEAPRKLVFDFACGLLEFALNREPTFWLRCRYPVLDQLRY
jgi:hypothetical protein